MWKLLNDKYSAMLVIGVINTRATLEISKLANNGDFKEYLSEMQSLWKDTKDEGANIPEFVCSQCQ